MQKKSFSILVATLLLLFVAVGCSGQSNAPAQTTPAASSGKSGGPDYGPYTPEKPLKLIGVSMGRGATNQSNMANAGFAAALEEASGGAVVVEVFNDATLAENDRTAIEGVLLGNWDIAFNQVAVLTSYVPELEVLDLPYLFSGEEHVQAFLTSDLMLEMCDLMTPTGARILAMTNYGPRNVFTKKPIYSAADMQGVTLRTVESDIVLQTFRAFGASPQAMAASEITAALQQGTIDGLEQQNNAMVNSGYWEFTPYGTNTQHMWALVSYSFSDARWQSLTPDLQELIQSTARKEAAMRAVQNVADGKVLEQEMTKKGVTFTDIDKESFISKMGPVHDAFIAKHGRDLYDRIRALDPTK